MHRKTPLLTVALSLLAVALVPSGAAASPGAPVVHDVDGAGSSARGYWTPKRMREARELRVSRRASARALRKAGLAALAGSAAPQGSPLSADSLATDIDPVTSIPPRPPAAGPGSAPRIVAPPFQSGQVDPATMTTYPYSANGKVFGKFPRRGGNYSCSATAVVSPSRSVIFTAGHCVHDRQLGWAKRIIFAPAYLSGSAPFGAWRSTRIVAPRGWVRSENFHYDYGAVKVRSDAGLLGDVVGEEGVAWSMPREQTYQAIGYPYNRGRTELMWNCVSGSAGVDPLDHSRGQPDTGIGCDMGSGASGGGWTVHDTAGNPFVNGVTSYGYKRLKNVLFAAYLTGSVQKVLNSADRG
ncbi:MAG: hypothetical protein H6533_12910 [Thermoleophilales bacterium]|nr:hypothetical protein [Thermoleophilales bacterium]